MDLCDQCGNKSLMPEHYSDVCLCKKCSMKLLSSTWKNKEYDSNEEIDRQMEKVIKLAGKYSYSPKVIEGLSSFFSSPLKYTSLPAAQRISAFGTRSLARQSTFMQ